jgi:RIO kinase 1
MFKKEGSDRTEIRKIWGGVFDNQTIMTIHKLMRKGVIKELVTPIKEGKESKVIAGIGKDGPIAIKIYAVEAANFGRMEPYLRGDPRFARVKKDRRAMVNAWCRKEFSNLNIAFKAGVAVPEPYAFSNNVLVMKFVGDVVNNAFAPCPRLTDTRPVHPDGLFNEVVANITALYRKAKLVHADLSEYNILLCDRPYIIDFSQATILEHPNADHFMRRDITNLCRYFKKIGVEADSAALYSTITGKQF